MILAIGGNRGAARRDPRAGGSRRPGGQPQMSVMGLAVALAPACGRP
jgi:hypothetical protein